MDTVAFQSEFLGRATMPAATDPATVIAEYLSTRADALAQAKGLGVDGDGLRMVRRRLASAFVRRWMMLRHAALDLSFAARPWWLVVERTADSDPRIVSASDVRPELPGDDVLRLVGSVPRFFRAESAAHGFAIRGGLDDDRDGKSYKVGSLLSGRRKSAAFRALDVSVHAKVPDGITAAHVRSAREAVAHLMLAQSLLFARGIDLDDECRKGRYESGGIGDAKVALIWAPNEDVLTLRSDPPRPAGDPAIVLEVVGHTFLLAFYDTPDERPIEHLIREFSEGKLPR